MRVLFTGASSVPGGRVLERLLQSADYEEILCAHHRGELKISDPRVHLIALDLKSDFNLREVPTPLDQVIHFAGVTHSHDVELYRQVNLRGTLRLAEEARARGCRKFVYVSTRCATAGSGAYGESKLAAEQELKKLSWESLLIIRPAEIYGGGAIDGIDAQMELARRWHIAPMLFGNPNIRFAPLHIDDFVAITTLLISNLREGLSEAELCGPEDLTGVDLARRLAREFGAIPLPLWWPLVDTLLKIGSAAGFHAVEPDQLQRLTCQKTASAGVGGQTGRVHFLQDKNS